MNEQELSRLALRVAQRARIAAATQLPETKPLEHADRRVHRGVRRNAPAIPATVGHLRVSQIVLHLANAVVVELKVGEDREDHPRDARLASRVGRVVDSSISAAARGRGEVCRPRVLASCSAGGQSREAAASCTSSTSTSACRVPRRATTRRPNVRLRSAPRGGARPSRSRATRLRSAATSRAGASDEIAKSLPPNGRIAVQ